MALILKEGRQEDFESYYNLKCEYTAVLFGGFSAPPDKEILRTHFNKLITDQNNDVVFFSIYDNSIHFRN